MAVIEDAVHKIALELDFPWVVMGGPNFHSVLKARKIVSLFQHLGWTPPLAEPAPSPVVAASVAEAGL